MNKRLGILLLLGLIPWLTQARTGRYRAMWRTNPATSMVIGWEAFSGRQSRMIFQAEGQSTDQWRAHYPDKMVASKDMKNYFARLEGLSPDTRYRFVIRDSEGDSPIMYFHTAPSDQSTPVTLIAGGDSRNNRSARKRMNLLAGQMQPLAILFSGDMTDMCTSREWQQWLDDWQLTITVDRRLIPIVPARGNHETSNSILEDLFDIPSPDAWYALAFGGDLLRVYTLNSLAPIHGRQTQWLEEDLQSIGDHFTWRIAQYHYPIRPHTRRKKERLDQLEAWAGLFHQHGVQLAQESDSHVAKVTWPIRPGSGPGSNEGFVRDDQDGTVYIGEGSWGAPLRPADDDKPWTRASGSFHQFNWLCFYPDRLDVRIIEADKSGNAIALPSLSYGQIPDAVASWIINGQEQLSIQGPVDDMAAIIQDAERFPLIDLEGRSSLQIPYRLDTPCEIRIEFTNTLRQVVKSILLDRKAGNYLEGIDTRDLPSGRYVLIVYADDKPIMRRLVQQ